MVKLTLEVMEEYVTKVFVDFLTPLFDEVLKSEFDNDKRNSQFVNIAKETVRVCFQYNAERLQITDRLVEEYLNQ